LNASLPSPALGGIGRRDEDEEVVATMATVVTAAAMVML